MNKKKNINNLNLLILAGLFLLLISNLNLSFVFDSSNINHWSTFHRDDIVFVYNSLLYAEGLDQHHLDHPSFFTFIVFPFFYKLAFYVGYLDFYNLSGFINSENINLSLSKLFFISKLSIQLFSLGIIFIFYKIIMKFSNRSVDSFLISFLFIISTGFTSASNRIESGLIAVFFALFAFYLILKFFEKNYKQNFIYLIIIFLLVFSAMLQKKIVYFALPFLFLSSIIFIKKNKIKYYDYKILEKFNIDYKYLLFFLYFFVFFFISYKTIINNTFILNRDLDFIFLVLNYAGFNLLFYLYIKFYQNKYYKNLLTYNLIFGSTYILYKYFLIYFFSAPVAIWSIAFTNFIGNLNMFTTDESIKGSFNFGSLFIYLEILISNFSQVFLKYFFSFTFQSVLIWTNLILFIKFFKKIHSKEKISFYFLFSGFLFVQSVILFRYEQDTYFLNSEFFLLISLSIFLRHIRVNSSYFFGSLIIITTLFFSNISHFERLKFANVDSICQTWDEKQAITFYKYWTKEIPENIILKFCNDVY